MRNLLYESGYNDDKRQYWLWAPGTNASYWKVCLKDGIACVGWDSVGDLSQYDSRAAITEELRRGGGDPDASYTNDSLCLWEFSHKMKPGDIIYARKGVFKIIGRGVVTGDYVFDDSYDEFRNIRKVVWTHTGEWQGTQRSVMKTLTDITKYPDYVEDMEKLFEKPASGDEKPDDSPTDKQQACEPYDDGCFLSEVFMGVGELRKLKALLRHKKNIILQGAPGVGKTFAATRLAYAVMGEKDDSRVMLVQFHQSCSYEDFIMGYKPDGNGGFTLKCGRFYNFCKRAEADPERDYFFIIDEINRGNLSKIFGELLMLIENGYRNRSIGLAYSDEEFSVPKNLHIIGMMNTADRSLAIVDYALRRRFSTFDMYPAFESEGFVKYREGLNSAKLDRVVAAVGELNRVIAGDDSLGDGFCIGHSHFCGRESFDELWLQNVVEYDIVPLLREYWFDNRSRFEHESRKLLDALK